MGRKRVKINLAEGSSTSVAEIDQKDEDGLYPFSLSWSWKPIKSADEVRLGLRFDHLSDQMQVKTLKSLERRNAENPLDAFLHTSFYESYPWAVEALGVALKTECLEVRHGVASASYKRLSLGRFLRFCMSENILLEGPEDLTYSLLCQYRAHLRTVEMDSRYKAKLFRNVTSTFERLMGSRYLQDRWIAPIYSSDASESVPMYSDAVMHQLVSACISDIDLVMRRAKEFQEAIPDCFVANTEENRRHAYSTNKAIRSYVEKYSLQSEPSRVLSDWSCSRTRRDWVGQLSLYRRGNQKFTSDMSSVLNEVDDSGSLLGGRFVDFAQREVATAQTLLPFYLLFLIYTGRNRETVNTWQRRYKVKNRWVSPTEWTDILSPDKCILRGVKSRGKGRLKNEVDDVHIKKSTIGLYPLLEFVIWYTEPLVAGADPKHKDLLWLALDQNYKLKTFSSKRDKTNIFLSEVREFLKRHEITEFIPKKGGGFKKERLSGIDTRRFRKNFAVRELMEAVSNCANHQELADTLRNSLKHGSFDTTIGSYLSHDTTMASRDVAIFTLQSEMLETARRFRGTLNDDGPRSGEPVILARCSDPSSPDFEMADQSDDGHCSEYDMCMGCSRSAVFEEHLPRIAMRIIQYEEERDGMSQAAWDAEYGQKHARAHDVLNSWSDQDAVNDAWTSAKDGEITLPKVMFRG